MGAHRGRLLLVGATELELGPLLAELGQPRPVDLPLGRFTSGLLSGEQVTAGVLGVGKVNTAAALATAVTALAPAAVVQYGVGGAFPASGLEVGSAAVAASETHLDTGAATAEGFEDLAALGFPLLRLDRDYYNQLPTDAALSARLAGAAGLPLVPFGTAETVTGTPAAAAALERRAGVAVESMEGAAAAQVCLALGVPFAQVRGISNPVGVRDRSRWDLPGAVGAATRAVLAFAAALAAGPAAGAGPQPRG